MLGGPNAGKSVAAASLFVACKKEHRSCEFVTEVAKDLVYEKNYVALSDQIYVFASTLYKLKNAYSHVQITITDSPILLSAIYNPNTSKHLMNLVMEQYHNFNNINVIIPRRIDNDHSMIGRITGLTESISIDNQIVHLLENNNIPYIIYDGDVNHLAHLIYDELNQ